MKGRSFHAAQLAHDLADDDHLRFIVCCKCRRKSDEGRISADGEFTCLSCIEAGDVGGSEEPEVALTVNVRGEW